MIMTIVSNPKQHLLKDMQHSVHISQDLIDILFKVTTDK